MLWAQAVELLQAAVFALSHLFAGSLGWAVVALSLTLRLALLPLTLRLAHRALLQRRRMAALQPRVLAIRDRFRNDPTRQWQALHELYRREGVRVFDPAQLLGGLAQAPLYALLFAALRGGFGAGKRFLMIADLSAPSLGLGIVVAGLAAAAVVVGPQPEVARKVAVMPALLAGLAMVWFLSRTSALFALASGSAAVVNLVQSAWLRRTARVGGM